MRRFGFRQQAIFWLVLTLSVTALVTRPIYLWLTAPKTPDKSTSASTDVHDAPPRSPADSSQKTTDFVTPDPPALSASPFQNTSPLAKYVGIAACAECHVDEHRTFHETPHSRALSDVDPSAEPPSASFVQVATGRTYSVYRDGKQLRHREAAKNAQGKDYVVADYAMRYLVGSGHHTRSYFAEVDGFLFESPITWYASRKSWGMSPGYDRPNHKSFERAADASCLNCHVGQMSEPDREYQRFTFPEQSIGCERCHGPGSLHVDERRAALKNSDLANVAHKPTIVNPSRLSRSLGEAICAQCHLMGDAAVTVRGRGIADFRPGLPLSDFSVNYVLDEPGSRMKVVGHVDQLHLSRCYQASEKLTCTTCHDPHAATRPERQREHFVQACLSCHAEESCRLERAERLRRNAADDCVACHMPQVETDIPHVAFTHHRIGVHAQTASAKSPPRQPGPLADLVPIEDVSRFSEIEQQRNLGLGYFALSQTQGNPEVAAGYRDRALRLLNGVRSRGFSDGEVAAALARLSLSQRDSATTLALAREALSSSNLSAKSRINALCYVGQIGVQTNRLDSAREAIEQLISFRRSSEDWMLLGVARQRGGDLPGALHDLQQAAAIAPFRADIHNNLGQIYEWLGNLAAAENERSIARGLAGQKPDND